MKTEMKQFIRKEEIDSEKSVSSGYRKEFILGCSESNCAMNYESTD